MRQKSTHKKTSTGRCLSCGDEREVAAHDWFSASRPRCYGCGGYMARRRDLYARKADGSRCDEWQPQKKHPSSPQRKKKPKKNTPLPLENLGHMHEQVKLLIDANGLTATSDEYSLLCSIASCMGGRGVKNSTIRRAFSRYRAICAKYGVESS